eukprot:CAMPEP_0172416750 /NCGR_PEP_ID=MMETSP1064-20121228/3251_1 /TAXON_ID=202472 /ORGANISM="Aulacoseira subarctica , Strain CCAP 1002/5" /LENGTH=316 /DNA_ID=CAMNT_0013154633 /DNA_START=74 /DNA_END=1024 /DNA_ORIENTATION=-
MSKEDNEMGGIVASDDKEVDEQPTKPRLNLLNYLNLLFYIANVLIINLVGTAGLGDLPTNAEQSSKYQTLVTPAGWAFSIWAVIYVFQGIWAILQLFPNYRTHPNVQKGVSYWYIGVCATQIGWTFLFTFDFIWQSLLLMSLVLVTLAGCVVGSYYQYVAAKKTFLEYWFFLFPFAIHFAWILCATLVNTNVVVVWATASAVTQITVAICSLALLHACGVWALFVPDRPNYTVPVVIFWATIAVYFELDNPSPLILATFDTTTILSIQYSALVVCLLMPLFIFIRLSVSLYSKCATKKIEAAGQYEEEEIASSPAV